jgi:hypothetical protein
MNDKYQYSFQERVVRLSVVAAIIVCVICILGWDLLVDGYFEDSFYFGIPLGLITFVSGLIHFKSRNPLGKFVPVATIAVYLVFFADSRLFNHGIEITFGIILSLIICLVSTFLYGILITWANKGK